MKKMRALGTSISFLPTFDSAEPVVVVGSLTSIGEITPDSEELDATTLDSPGGYREYLQGFKDSGEVSLTGYHNPDAPGQATMRELYVSGNLGYFWVTFPDGTTVAFKAYVKSHSVGAADVDGIVGFAATLRVSGLVQVISIADAEAQEIANGASATLVATSDVLTGTPTYQWKTATDENNGGAANVSGGSGATTDTYITPVLTAGTYYYFCVVTVPGYLPTKSQTHVITVA